MLIKLGGTTYKVETNEGGEISKATVGGKIIPLSAMLPSVVNMLQKKIDEAKK